MITIAIHPVNFILALSLALELSDKGLSSHHYQTAVISHAIAKRLGLPHGDIQVATCAALLHDIGAAASWDEKRHIVHFAQDNRIFYHAEKGYQLLKDSAQLGDLALPIRYHHDHFCGISLTGLQGEEIPLISRILHLADRMSVLIRDDRHIFQQRHSIMEQIEACSGTHFDPQLVKVIQEVGRHEKFWLDLSTSLYRSYFFKEIAAFGRLYFNLDDMVHMAELFATVIDATSSYTAAHSRHVAAVSSYLASLIGFSKGEIQLIRIAGLLHDLGKLAVPNHILDKPGKLTDEEYMLVKQHTYYTQRILETIDNFGMVAAWASQHHETLDGSGYPYGLSGDYIHMGSRLIAVADIFCALAEDRPYRDPFSCEQIQAVFARMVEQGKLDNGLVAVLVKNIEQAREQISAIDNGNGELDISRRLV